MASNIWTGPGEVEWVAAVAHGVFWNKFTDLEWNEETDNLSALSLYQRNAYRIRIASLYLSIYVWQIVHRYATTHVESSLLKKEPNQQSGSLKTFSQI